MQRPAAKSLHRVLVLCFALAGLPACEGTQAVSLTTEDFRFVPNRVRATAASPLSLSVFNAGREIHEFDSPILQYAVGNPTAMKPGLSGIVIAPGETLRLVVAPPAGTYLYICRRKGHVDMTGTLIVE